MLRIGVQNFQSVLDVAVDIEGYVALVGKSNIGKSAIVRAMQCALTGASGTDFVRHSQLCDRRIRQTKKCKCFTKVTIETSALKVVWEKGDAVNRYTVTREGVTDVFEGLERGTPPFLEGAFSLVVVGDDKELIQVPDQFDPIFLLNQTGSVVANVMSDVARLDEVNAALTAVNKDRKEAASKRRVREEDVVRLKSELEAYAGLDAVDTENLEKAQAELISTQNLLARLERFIEQARALKETLLALKAATAPKVPDVDVLDAPVEQLENVAKYEERLQVLVPAIEALAPAVAVELPDIEPLKATYDKAVLADELTERLTLLATPLKKLKGVDAVRLPDDSELGPAYESFLLAERFLGRLEVSQRGLEGLRGFSELPDIDLDVVRQAQASLETVETRITKIDGLNAVVADLAAKLKTSEDEEQRLLAELQGMGLCPTCSQDIDADHCLRLEAS